MDLIEEFINRYTKEYDFYDQAGRLARQELEAVLQESGIRSIVTHRAKSISRLRDKCRQRQGVDNRYRSVNDIYNDVVDLTGVRVALYFPAEREQVNGIINRLFHVHEKKVFPAHNAKKEDTKKEDKRFTGYSAVHYRVQLKERNLSDLDKRYAQAKIEIQVASILMHAWAEVEHDLIYKPMAGELSEDEYAILDQLNGLVISGEIALEMLQRAGEARITVGNRPFANHYELAAHLIRIATSKIKEPISESGLGRVDLLFDFATRLGLNTPGDLAPYIEVLHDNLELRPLAEQIADALLVENPARYDIYRTLQTGRDSNLPVSSSDDDYYHLMGIFMSHWIELERLARTVVPAQEARRPVMPTSHLFRTLGVLSPEMIAEFDQLRRLRNYLVHGIEPMNSSLLAEASQRLEVIKKEIQKRVAKLNKEHPKEEGD
ncbi:RelA/SpoT domain-containing protein [Streptosporangium saharense]|uniref:RelA/SpoT domain-containing protein n=1 Tax=Streptosporangium saharense TaxID=1706840 RepID=UPI0034140645